MRKDFLFIIALVLAFAQGFRAEAHSNEFFNSQLTEEVTLRSDEANSDGMVSQPSATTTLGAGRNNLIGDVNQDGKVTITDVTALIDILIGEDYNNLAGDVNQDGMVSIMDITILIDIILNTPDTPDTPTVEYYPTILLTTKDGVTMEYLIDESTKLKLLKPDLVIESDEMSLTYELSNMAQLCYGQYQVTPNQSIMQNPDVPTVGTLFLFGMNENALTEVTNADGKVVMSSRGDTKVQFDNEPSGEYVITTDCQTFKIVKK